MNIIIDDVAIKELLTHHDDRGFFREILRSSDDTFEGFGQWSMSVMLQDVIKAWHIHKIQYDFWFVPSGVIKAVLCDMRGDSPTYLKKQEFVMGEGIAPFVLKIPPGVAHGLKVLQGPATLFYITSEEYNPEDEGRIRYDDSQINYNWFLREIT